MIKKLSQTIKKLRLQNDFTQEFVSKKMEISRPTYMQIEKGERELTIAEARKLASIFSISFDDFINRKESKCFKITLEKQEVCQNTKQEMRISVPQENIIKFKETLLYILEKVGARLNIGETAIYKLLYFIDFDSV